MDFGIKANTMPIAVKLTPEIQMAIGLEPNMMPMAIAYT